MPHYHYGQIVSLLNKRGNPLFVGNGFMKKVAFARKTQRVGVGIAVRSVVVAYRYKTRGIEKLCKLVVPGYMLRHAVYKLHCSARRFYVIPYF